MISPLLKSRTESVPSSSNAEIEENESFENYRSIGFEVKVAYLINKGGLCFISQTSINEFEVPRAKNQELNERTLHMIPPAEGFPKKNAWLILY